MKQNMGGIDRILRIVVGLALIAFAVFGPAGMIWTKVAWIGVVPLLTGVVGICPAYLPFGVKTCKTQ